MDQFMKPFKDSGFYQLLDKWGLLKDKTAISNMMKNAITHFMKSKSKEFEILKGFLISVMNKAKGGFKKLQKVPTHVFVAALTPIQNQSKFVIYDIFRCSVEANLELIESQLQDNPSFKTTDKNSLESLDIHKEINKSNFETEDAANEFYLAFAWHLYITAIDRAVGPLFKDVFEEDEMQSFSEFWRDILLSSASFDADAPEWDQLPSFLKRLETLKTNIKQNKEKEAQQIIETSLNELKEKHESFINLFEMKNLLLWSGSSISPSISPSFNDTLQKLIEEFDKYKRLDTQYNESKYIRNKGKLRKSFDKIEGDLLKLYDQACGIMDEATAAEAEEQEAKAIIKRKELEKLDSHGPGIENDKSRDMTEKVNKILDRNKELEKQVAEQNRMLAAKEYEKNEIGKKFEEVSSELTERHLKIEAISNLSELPKNLREGVELMEAIFPEKLSFSAEAKKSAKTASNIPIDIAWPCLFQMATTLHDLFFVETEKGIDREKEFNDRTGLGLAMTEGRQTKRDPSLLKLRTIVYEGKEISIVPHVKSGTKKPKLLRVYFYPDQEKKKIIVGHCGDHLDNYSTQSLK
jgi:hypothetical protein